ncbi:hypothetical protein SAMN05445871_1542 [Paraburkholderia caballeronis]|uniref:Uncharacterized protein n=1 Tax=Paraburkholderia caballeronis TaxID=416943 RepID=A0A1H7N467_9BURK|nr:hypothetical protein C7403_104153 [Paraburkholderia caballeronis]PXX01828.1 hypothetical protein C7407_104153 [Paraburkholderia caballeronis]RAK00985.1 hypothetical protein C7409_104153 [Paraburkholderia caballeronis]TDV38195.1 hypothetical protein C7405_102401 [Paraburkholderia caballeronis]SEC04559.1 hypothetical protein SAMN05445871_1542 [Paraburkholderia caballeronis]
MTVLMIPPVFLLMLPLTFLLMILFPSRLA